jgi:membrane protease YdiL (CAAX protease family)
MQVNEEKKPILEESQPASFNRQVWGLWITVALGVAVVAAMVLIVILAAIIFSILQSLTQFEDTLANNERLFTSLVSMLAALAGIGLIFLFIKLRKGASIKEYLGLQRVNLKSFLIWLAVMIGLIVVTDGLSYILGRPFNPQTNVDMYNSSVFPALIWLETIVFAPAIEETLFRGFLFEGFRRSRMGVILTVVLLALVWTSLHFDYDLFTLAGVFVGGILLGIARQKTNSLWVPISMHVFGNLVATVEIALNMNALIK